MPAFGLHHHSEQNAFNLADDLIEPFRPLVDLFVRLRVSGDDSELTPTDKGALVELLHYDLLTPDGISAALAVTDRMAASLLRVIDKSDSELLELPILLPLLVHTDEH